jgi:hypothetical protein
MEIACIERNGDISSYDVQLLVQSTGVMIRDVNVPGLTYTATELKPFTSYTFRVAGVNINGTGPFAERTFTTAEARKPLSSMLLTCDLITTSISHTAPGPVFNLTVEPQFTSVQLTWGAPEVPNGVIIQYEVTYRVSGGSLMTNITGAATTVFTIQSLMPNTMQCLVEWS